MIQKLFKKLRALLSPRVWIRSAKAWFLNTKHLLFFTIDVLRFNVLLISYLFAQLFTRIGNMRFFPGFLKAILAPPLAYVYQFICSHNRRKDQTINRLNLIQLATKNMMSRRSRAIITMGGMAVGIGAIVFLVSLGYGVQRLVITRVARLEELSQADIATQPGSQVSITDDELETIANFEETNVVLPMISVVGRVNYNNSISDMAVYGVTSKYLEHSAIRTMRGKAFESDQVSVAPGLQKGQVAGVMTVADLPEELAEDASDIAQNENNQNENKQAGYVRDVAISITPGEWLRVRQEPSSDSEILGYTRRIQGNAIATEVIGERYEIPGATTGQTTSDLWITRQFTLWERDRCQETTEKCEGGYFYTPLLDDRGEQVVKEGYTAEIRMVVSDAYTATRVQPEISGEVFEEAEGGLGETAGGKVLGETIDITELLAGETFATDSASLELLQIASASGILENQDQTVRLELADSAIKEAVVNQSMLQVLGISIDEAVGKTFSAQFVITSDLLENSEEKKESVPADYKIVGVIPGTDTPFFYVPFVDLRGLGVSNYSQAKLVVKTKNVLDDVRTKVEAMGFTTSSVADTVNQIDQLFATARMLLAILGIVALSVAALGMFNTLTVSLLERTREVGLMKAMGMRSHEVQDLFLTESMIMGFFGGVFGISIGFIGGKLLGLLLTLVALSSGGGYLDVSYIPPTFLIVVFTLSLTVGILTGLYPAYRATKISALDALRYE